MTVQSNFSAIRGIQLGQLFLSPLNVRKGDSEKNIPELARSIEMEGILQNLAGYEDTFIDGKRSRRKGVGVVAGGRRWRALQWLLKHGKINKNYVVPCLVTSKEAAIAISLAENTDREALHPADEFEAARALVDGGKSIEDVAAQLRLAPLTVQRRLKLANVAPDFIQLYRDEALTLEHLMAFALTDDHQKQQQVWKGLPLHNRSPQAIREALTETEVSASDPLARFVTVKAYERAGGQCRRDLFSDDNDVFLLDVELLKELAQKKLAKKAAALKDEGVTWVDVSPRVVDYAERTGYARVATSERTPTPTERAQLAALDRQYAQVEAEENEAAEGDADLGEEALAALDARREHIDTEREALLATLAVPNPEQQAKAGALVCIGRDGHLNVETGLLKSEDAKLFAAQARRDGKAQSGDALRSHSATLLLRMTAHRTLALRAVFAQSPEVALAAVVHRLVIDTFHGYRSTSESALQIPSSEGRLSGYANDLESTPAHAWLEAQRKHFESLLPEDPEALFPWLLQQSSVEKLALLAFCAALRLDAVQNHEEESAADVLARALQIDLRQWWTPSAAGYFHSVPKAVTLQAVTEGASAEAAARLEPLKKQALAEEADKALAGKGWLPAFLRSSWMPAT